MSPEARTAEYHVAPSLGDYFPKDLRRKFRERVLGAMNSGPQVPEFPEDPTRQFRERALGAMNSRPRVPEFPEDPRRYSSERGRSEP